MPKPWYIDGFGAHYLELYAHRNEREAAQALALLETGGVELKGRWILDMGCGGGRHLTILRRKGARALGLDLSWPLLDEARRQMAPGLALLRADMRSLPLRSDTWDGALSMFTSFGYFHSDAENWRVLAELRRVLASGGFVFFDFLNREQLISGLQAQSERQSEHWAAKEKRRIEGGRVFKEVRIRDRRSGEESLRYEESVRLFTPAEIRTEFARLGFREIRFWGSYQGEEFDPGQSPRFILLLRKEGS